MINNEIIFYKQEKFRFNELLNKFGWTEDCLLNEKEFIQCPIDRGHRFPIGSKHLQNCQLVKEGYSKDYEKELIECEQEKQLLNQSSILLSPSTLSNILHRPITITNNIPLNNEQTTILFTPNERSLIAQTIHNEALRLEIVPLTPFNHLPIQLENSNASQQINKLEELRDQKRRRAKYVTRTIKKSFYDIAREMINTKMELIKTIDHQMNINQTKHNENSKHRHSKHKHRSSSKKKHHKKRRSNSKHQRHSKKRRTS